MKSNPEENEALVAVESEAISRPRRKRRRRSAAGVEERRAQMREVCLELLECWLPVATSDELKINRMQRGKVILDEEPVETGLKAGTFVIKILERLARLDGLDSAEKKEVAVTETVDPLELARRVEVISPLLVGKLSEGLPRERPGV